MHSPRARRPTLSPTEAERLEFLERRIRAGLRTFLAVGHALTEIRDLRLYRGDFRTFDDYCRAKWSMGRRHAYQLIDAAEIVENVRNCAHDSDDGIRAADLPMPANEAQVRPLKRLPAELQMAAWLRAVETAPYGRVTAAHVDSVVQAMERRPNLTVHYSSQSDEWHTPKHIISAVESTLGSIDLDPCSPCDARPVPALRRFTKVEDGLAQRWEGKVFMNPPYGSELSRWTTKLQTEYESGEVTAAIALVPARTDTFWFRALGEYALCFLHGRLKFSGSATSAPFPSSVFYLGEDISRFAEVFAHLGDTYIRMPVDTGPR
jgi:hypothetical protein